MPYQCDRLKLKLPKEFDKRRCGLTDADKELIKQLYVDGWAIRKIARYFEDKCSRRLIIFILFPERLKKMQLKHKLEKHHLKYYDKDKWRLYMRAHRQHRAEVFHASRKDKSIKK